MKNLVTILWLLIVSQSVHGQAGIDPGKWVLDSSKSDEFNGSSLDTSKWWTINACEFTDSIPHGYNGGDGAFFRPQNVAVDSGDLILSVDYNPDSLSDSFPCVHHSIYPYYSGGIMSHLWNGGPGIGGIGNFTFGYYEMRAKLPGFYMGNQPIGQGLWPAFWMYYQYPGAGCMQVHDEVDIVDSGTDIYGTASEVGSGFSDEDGHCGAYGFNPRPLKITPEPLFVNYHKYAVEFLPDRIIFYFDDQPYYSADTIASPGIVHSLNMSSYLALVINLQMGGNGVSPEPFSTTPFPLFMYVDYFRYYRLNPDYNTGNSLSQNFPNPVSQTTEIDYSIDNEATNPLVNIYSLPGGEIKKSVRLVNRGRSKILLDVSDLNSGLYFYSLVVDDRVIATKRMIVLK